MLEYLRIQKTGHSTELSLVYWRTKMKLLQLLKTEHNMLKLDVKKAPEISAVFGMQWLLKTLNWPCFSTLVKAERLGQELKENQIWTKGPPYRCEIDNGDWRLKINESGKRDGSKDWYLNLFENKIKYWRISILKLKIYS